METKGCIGVCRDSFYSLKNSFDTPYDFVNHRTFGILDAVWTGSIDRSDKKWNSTSDYFNYLTAGITGTVEGAVNPDDPFSSDHLLNSFGLATSLTGVGKVVTPKPASGVSGGSKPKETENTGKKISEANPKVIDELEGPVIDGKRVGSGEKVDDIKPVWGRDEKGRPFIEKEFPHVSKEHGFSEVIDNYSRFSEEFPLVGGDGVKRRLFQIEGSNNGEKGVFEWIVEPNGDVSHRRFIENGITTGTPNQIPKK